MWKKILSLWASEGPTEPSYQRIPMLVGDVWYDWAEKEHQRHNRQCVLDTMNSFQSFPTMCICSFPWGSLRTTLCTGSEHSNPAGGFASPSCYNGGWFWAELSLDPAFYQAAEWWSQGISQYNSFLFLPGAVYVQSMHEPQPARPFGCGWAVHGSALQLLTCVGTVLLRIPLPAPV